MVLVNLLGVVLVGAGSPIEFRPGLYISIKGVAIFELIPSSMFGIWMVFVVIGLVVGTALWRYFGYVTESTGRPIPRTRYAIASIFGFALIGWVVLGMRPTPTVIPVFDEDKDSIVELPYEDAFESGLLTIEQELDFTRQPLLYRPPTLDRRGRNIETGIEISPSYLAVFLGLVMYTSSFIAEIVRAGIQAVPKGQLEASRALGISQGEMLRLIILPQALRVIIPAHGQSVSQSGQELELGNRSVVHGYIPGGKHHHQSVGAIRDRHCDDYAFLSADKPLNFVADEPV